MDDPLLVGRHQRRQNLRQDADHVIERKGALDVDPVRQRLAVKALHDQVRRAVAQAPHVVDLANVGMADGAGSPRFLVESRDRFLAAEVGAVEHLDGHTASDFQVLGLVDRTHAAFADEIEHAVLVANDAADQAVLLALRRCHGASSAARLTLAHERNRHRVPARFLLLRGTWRSALALSPNGLAGDRTNLVRQIVRQSAMMTTYEALAQRLGFSGTERGHVCRHILASVEPSGRSTFPQHHEWLEGSPISARLFERCQRAKR